MVAYRRRVGAGRFADDESAAGRLRVDVYHHGHQQGLRCGLDKPGGHRYSCGHYKTNGCHSASGPDENENRCRGRSESECDAGSLWDGHVESVGKWHVVALDRTYDATYSSISSFNGNSHGE